MKANKLTVFLRCAVSLLLCTVLLFSSGIAQCLSDEILNPSWRAKINDDLWEAMEGLDDDDIITVWLWKQNEPIRQNINTALRTEKGMDPDVYEDSDRFEAQVVPTLLSSLQGGIMLSETSAILSRDSEPVKNAVNEVRAEYAAARKEITRREYTEANTDFVEKYVDEENRSILYFSNYTSTLILEATKSEIIEYAKTSEVTEISLHIEVEAVPEEDIAFSQIHADTVNGTKSSDFNSGQGYKGRGVTIGIIEVKGHFKTNHPQFSSIYGQEANSQLRIIDNAGLNGAPVGLGAYAHASYVTSLLVGQPYTIENDPSTDEDDEIYEGIVPLANAILTPIITGEDMIRALQKLIDAECNIINLSAGISSEGEYSHYDKEFDRIIINSNAVVVKSAGNVNFDKNGNLVQESVNISSPGNAANVITVGNAYTKGGYNSAVSAPYKITNVSGYEEAEYLTNKPDISAPGCNITYVTSSGEITAVTGTSFSAPIVTGVIAQMMEANEDLKDSPKKIKSILLASADYHKINPDRDQNLGSHCIEDNEVGTFLREVSGAGLVNAGRAVNMAKGINTNTVVRDLTSTGYTIVSAGSISSGEKIRVVMTFYKNNSNTIGSTSMRDNVDLYIKYNYSSTLLDTSTSSVNNVEIVEYKASRDESGGTVNCVFDVKRLYSPKIPISYTVYKWRPGDVNGDGVTNSVDASIIAQYDAELITLSPEQLFVADVNKDCVVNSIDQAWVLQYDSLLRDNLQ
ncbi:MAG: hypothetical protein E7597_08770 [Ruminococcaceae bacterium]|nr:hypothetical protein [Oscillospiraceae bacterium]